MITESVNLSYLNKNLVQQIILFCMCYFTAYRNVIQKLMNAVSCKIRVLY